MILVPEKDDFVNPVGVKGIGELGNVGTAAAVANAVYHATGIRVRQLPIRLENLLATSAFLPVIWFIEPTSVAIQFCAVRHARACVKLTLP